ncbi:MAG: hypothetical protein ABIY70_00605 [Capsulimonas sp.]|uniref:hypothetical protein n=1 Tax=Capsulimonas sp. TaxID=2494211 RepID=UPI0032671E96
MIFSKHRAAIFPALSILVFLTLLAAPQTGWIVRTQAAHVFARGGSLWDLETPPTAKIPDSDYQLQLGALTGNAAQRLAQARALRQRFPTQASLYANILRYDVQSKVHLPHSTASDMLSSRLWSTNDKRPESTKAELDAFDRDAAAGERLDPNNAYFPAMRSIGLFASGRSAEAIAALHRAAQKTTCQDYMLDEGQGELRRREMERGRQNAIAQLSATGSRYSRHYSELHAPAHLAAKFAMQAEIAGRTNEGSQIRRDLMRLGGVMRTQSRNEDGAKIGVEIARAALLRPGGAPLNSNTDGGPPEDDLNAYCRFLTKIGHARDIPAVRSEFANGGEAQSIVYHVQGFDTWALSPEWDGLTEQWIVNWTLLVNAVWLIVLGLAAMAITRVMRSEVSSTPTQRMIKMATISTILLALALTVAPGIKAQARLLLASVQYVSWYENDLDWLRPDSGSNTTRILILTAAPILLFAGCLLASLVRRKSPRTPFYQRLNRYAWPLAGVVIFAYAASVLATIHAEYLRTMDVNAMVQNEGAYYAQWENREWPAATAWPGDWK